MTRLRHMDWVVSLALVVASLAACGRDQTSSRPTPSPTPQSSAQQVASVVAAYGSKVRLAIEKDQALRDRGSKPGIGTIIGMTDIEAAAKALSTQLEAMAPPLAEGRALYQATAAAALALSTHIPTYFKCSLKTPCPDQLRVVEEDEAEMLTQLDGWKPYGA